MSIFSGGTSLKFEEEGIIHEILVDTVEDEDTTDLEDNPVVVTVIRGIDEDGDECALWVQKRQLGYAIGQAVKEATGTAEEPKKGGKLKIKRGPDGEAKKAGFSAPHSFVARYEAPSATSSDVFDEGPTIDESEDPF